MFDLHSHILPFTDDGARDVKMSLAMLEAAKEQRIEKVVATSHCVVKDQKAIDDFIAKRQENYEKLLSEIADKNKYPEILLGAEVHLCKDISEFDNLSALCYQNTNYMLLEMSKENKPAKLSEWVYNIIIKGFRPVIAHVDRYSFYEEIMDELSPFDVVYQVNAARFLSMSDRRHLKNVFRLHNKFVASSDMHNISSRVCNMAQARKIAEKKFPDMTGMLFEEGARAILSNKAFPEF